MPNHKLLLINLERSKKRLEKSAELLGVIGQDFERIGAVDGTQLRDKEVEQIYSFDDKDSYYKRLNKGEIGCYLSHKKTWQKIVDERLDFAVILEDDFESCDQLKEAIRQIEKIEGEWDYIKLADHHRKRSFASSKNAGQFVLGVFDKLPAGTMAQAVSFSGAKKLLKHSGKIKRPVDIAIQHAFDFSLLTFGLQKAPIIVGNYSASEIETQGTRQQADRNRLKQFKQELSFKLKNKAYRNVLIQALKSISIG